MTYKELAKEISRLTDEQQNTDVTVFVRGVDEFYPVSNRLFITDSEDGDVLDPNHPYLQV